MEIALRWQEDGLYIAGHPRHIGSLLDHLMIDRVTGEEALKRVKIVSYGEGFKISGDKEDLDGIVSFNIISWANHLAGGSLHRDDSTTVTYLRGLPDPE